MKTNNTKNDMKNYYRVTCFVPELAFACDVPQLREKVTEVPTGVKFDEDGVSNPEAAVVKGGELAVWYEQAK